MPDIYHKQEETLFDFIQKDYFLIFVRIYSERNSKFIPLLTKKVIFKRHKYTLWLKKNHSDVKNRIQTPCIYKHRKQGSKKENIPLRNRSH